MATPAPVTLAELLEAPADHCMLKGEYETWNPLFADLPNHTPIDTRSAVVVAPHQGVLTVLLLIHDNKIFAYALPFRAEKVGSRTTPHDNVIFAFRGDVRRGVAPKLVKVLDPLFNAVRSNSYARATAELVQHYGIDGADELVGAVTSATAHAEELSTRSAVLAPTKFAKQFWNFPEGMPLAHFWTVVYPLVTAEPNPDVYSGFVNFMRLATTSKATDVTQSILNTDRLALADTSDEVDDLAMRILHSFLPALNTSSAGGHGAIDTTHLVGRLTSMMDQSQKFRDEDKAEEEKKEAEREDKKLEKALGGAVKQLGAIIYGNPNPKNWPKHYQDLATAKSSERGALDLAAAKAELLAQGEHELAESVAIHPQVIRADMMFDWIMDLVSLAGGGSMNSFNWTDEAMVVAKQVFQDYVLLNEGGVPTLEDSKSMMAMPLNLPTHNGSIPALKRQLAFLRGKLPPGNKIVAFLGAHIKAMEGMRYTWESYTTFDASQAALKGVYHLLWVAVHIRQYLRKVMRGEHPDAVADPYEICDYIGLQKRWEPQLDDLFYVKHDLPTLIRLSGRGGLKGEDDTLSTAASTLTGASSLGSGRLGGKDSFAGTDTDSTKKSGSGGHTPNKKFNMALFGVYKQSARKARELRRLIDQKKLPALPKSKVDGLPMCLAWHSKGECNENCPRRDDHVEYTADQYGELCGWCADNYEKDV